MKLRLLALFASTWAGVARGDEVLRPVVAEQVKEVARIVAETKRGAVRLGDFLEPVPPLARARGEKVRTMYEEEFRRAGLPHSQDAALRIDVDYRAVEYDGQKQLVKLKILITVIEPASKREVGSREKVVNDPAILSQLNRPELNFFDDMLDQLARKIAAEMEGPKFNACNNNVAQGPIDYTSSAGVGVADRLAAKLKTMSNKRGPIRVTEDASVRFRGEYTVVPASAGGVATVTITIDLTDMTTNDKLATCVVTGKFGGTPQPRPEVILPDDPDGTEAFSLFAGITGDIPADLSYQARARVVVDRMVKPEPAADKGGPIRSSERSLYSTQIIVDGKPAVPRVTANGQVWIDLRKGQTYSIRVKNESPYDAAVPIWIDGLSMFRFGDSPARYLRVPAGEERDIEGWYITESKTAQFLVESYPEADKRAGKSLPRTPHVGSITVGFAAAWPKDGKAPPDEVNFLRKQAGERLRTALGPKIDVAYRPVELIVGLPRSFVTIRYSCPE